MRLRSLVRLGRAGQTGATARARGARARLGASCCTVPRVHNSALQFMVIYCAMRVRSPLSRVERLCWLARCAQRRSGRKRP